MTSSIKHSTLTVAAAAALVAGASLSAWAATPSTGQSKNRSISHGSAVWSWPIDKEARSHVWTDARTAKARHSKVGSGNGLRKSAVRGGL